MYKFQLQYCSNMSTPELGVIKFQTKNETRTNKVFPMHQSMERLDLQFDRGEKDYSEV